MNNFTPLKSKKKQKSNFFLIANIFLMILVVGITGYYLRNKLITTEEKAYVPTSERPCSEYHATNGCGEALKECAVKAPRCEWINSGQTTVWSGGVGSPEVQCPGQCVGEGGEGGFEIPKCPNGQDPICESPAVTSCVRIMNCEIPSKILVQNGFCGTDPLKITCQTNCTCETQVTPTPTQPAATNTPPPPTNTPSPTPTQPVMSTCNSLCSNSTPCFNEEPGPNELVCTSLGAAQKCRNKSCPSSPNCICPTITPSATPIITNTPTPTGTPGPTATNTPVPSATPTTPPGQPTNTPGPTATPIPVLCGTKDCDNTTNPCRSGYNCVQAHDGSNYCTSPDFTEACKANPSYNTCCTAPGAPTATPTEIVLAKTTITPAPPASGTPAWLMFIIPALILIVGLL
ncbi:MAG: Integrin alpha beta-propellor repeat protein [Candidatus Roizmanbacteria bacterium GW2011_GWA2_35_19]|uniref:Integrin alpha beta-propellor repeat protein n=2 Tax=Candidatus Roizmaniibacteriota TaxID=1752723 RepID=A0A0G0EXJ5_9BACT|nr:MAG: Integrin alpha beta-propellor repeat protein [Candidatus Roizmanbacteria bacterium GW2011_GWC2_35_12]KKP71872.1 MAG: Integrin alpha beta-propellor repeat protein [Candidatus Roizmanbacteria bacterium GW2011_GWA2_35_19]